MKKSKLPIALAGAVIVFLTGFVIGRLVVDGGSPFSFGRHASPAGPRADSFLLPAFLTGMPDVRQSTGYTCGAAALQAVLAHWGISEREDRIAARLRTTPEHGTHPMDIVRGAAEFGLRAELREGLGLADLEAGLKSGATIIVDLQAWRGNEEKPWTETWEDGHYMVLLGMDGRNLYFEDPSLLGSRGFIPRQEFLDRWHDYEGDPPPDARDRKYVHMAIFIRGEKPVLWPPLQQVH